MIYALAFAASFVYVFLKALQQLNVVHGSVWWILPVSFGMAVCEVFVVVNVASAGWGWIIFPIGFGSGLGCLVAMHFHRRIR